METSENPGRGKTEGSKTTQFKPGHPGRKHGGRKPRPPSQLLRDMRFVYGQDESKDRTPGQKHCRQILKEDANRFFAQLAKLESSHEAGAAKVKPTRSVVAEPEEVVDEGTDLALERLNEFLANVKEDAEFARMPNAAEIGSSLQKSLAGALEREKELRERVKELEQAAAAKANA